MKADIHPQYDEIAVTCSCGNTFKTNSTMGKPLHIEVCFGLSPVLYRHAKNRGYRWSSREVPSKICQAW